MNTNSNGSVQFTGDFPILIIGMHRSGTSCLAGSLQQAGLHLGTVFEWNPYNLKGNRENERIMKLNDAVLTASGGTWSHPPDRIKWNQMLSAERDMIINEFVSTNIHPWGFKDPRTTLTLPFWQEGLEEIKLVASFRHPLLSAKSLFARNTMPIEEGLALWQAYNQRILAYIDKEEFPIISFDITRNEYLSAIDNLKTIFGLHSDTDERTGNFIDDSLINQTLSNEYFSLPSEVRRTYQQLCDIFLQQQKRTQ